MCVCMCVRVRVCVCVYMYNSLYNTSTLILTKKYIYRC